MKKSQFAILIAVIVLCAGGIFGFIYYKLNNKNTSDTNKQSIKCNKEFNYNNVLKYNFEIRDNDLVLNVYSDDIKKIEIINRDYVSLNETGTSNDYCNNYNVNIANIVSNDNYNYYTVEWRNKSDNALIDYSVIKGDNNNFTQLLDLTENGKIKYEDTNRKEIDSYRLINNSIFTIENDSNIGKEVKYTFENGSYKKEYTGIVYNVISEKTSSNDLPVPVIESVISYSYPLYSGWYNESYMASHIVINTKQIEKSERIDGIEIYRSCIQACKTGEEIEGKELTFLADKSLNESLDFYTYDNFETDIDFAARYYYIDNGVKHVGSWSSISNITSKKEGNSYDFRHLCVKENKKAGDTLTKNDFIECTSKASTKVNDLDSYVQYINQKGILVSTDRIGNYNNPSIMPSPYEKALFNWDMFGTEGKYTKVVLNTNKKPTDIIYIKDFDMYIPKTNEFSIETAKFYIKDGNVYYEGYGVKDKLIFDKEKATYISNWASCCAFEDVMTIYTESNNVYILGYGSDNLNEYETFHNIKIIDMVKKLNINGIVDTINRYNDTGYHTPELYFITNKGEVITYYDAVRR